MVMIDGNDVAPGTAAAFFRTRDAFGQRFPGCALLVSDGRRTIEQQQKAWDAYQNGTGKLAAPPNPSAPHVRGVALDLRDSWDSPGVATGWNERADWLRANCGRWGFAATGYGFSQVEPWHYEYQGDPWDGSALAAMTSTEEAEILSPWEEEDMPTIISSVIGQSLAIGPVIVSFGTPEDLKSALDAKVPVLGTSRAMHERILQAAKVATPMPLLVVYGDPGGTVYTFDGDSLDPIYDPDTLNKLLALPGVKPETWSAGEIQRRNAAKK